MNDIFIFKTTNDMDNGIALSNGTQKGIAQAFSGRCTLDESSDIHKFERGRHNLDGFVYLGQHVESGIGDTNNARIGFNGTKGIIGCFGPLSFRQGIKQGTFTCRKCKQEAERMRIVWG